MKNRLRQPTGASTWPRSLFSAAKKKVSVEEMFRWSTPAMLTAVCVRAANPF